MEMSEIQAARLLLGGAGLSGSGGSQQGGSQGYGSATVRYGTVTAVDAEAGTVTVLLDGQAEPMTLTDATAAKRLKAGDRVKIVKQGQSWVIDLAGGISRALDASIEEANEKFAADKARMDAHDKKMAQYEKDMSAAKNDLAGMDGKISDAVEKAVSQIETPDGGNHIYAAGSEPTAPDGGFQAGDLWYQTNPDGQIAAVKVWNGERWNAYDLVANSILVAGSVGSTLIADGAVTTRKITSGAVTANQIAANTITGAEIRADSVDVNQIASGDIYCKRLSAVSGTGYARVTGSGLELYDSSTSSLLNIGSYDEGSVALVARSSDYSDVTLTAMGGGTLKVSNSLTFSGNGGGIVSNGYHVPTIHYGSATAKDGESCPLDFSNDLTGCAFVFVGWADQQGAYHGNVFPFVAGGKYWLSGCKTNIGQAYVVAGSIVINRKGWYFGTQSYETQGPSLTDVGVNNFAVRAIHGITYA